MSPRVPLSVVAARFVASVALLAFAGAVLGVFVGALAAVAYRVFSWLS